MKAKVNNLKQSKLFVLIMILVMLMLIGIGTYALRIWMSNENTELTFRIAQLEGCIVNKGIDINVSNIGPVFDYEQDGEMTAFNAINLTEEVATVNVNFNISSITDNLKEESFKYVLLSSNDNINYTKVKEDNFANVNNNSTIELIKDYELTSSIYFKLYIYIDGNMLNPSTMKGGSLVGSISLNACEVDLRIDNSGANYPKLVDGLIPVMYDESTSKWVKADTTSSTSTYGWYDYNQKKWANAVLVTSTNRATYQSASAGTTINDSDILAFYVWIPRYKYKVWNINKVIGTDSYNAYNTGIDIKFENGTETSGIITCNYDFSKTASASVRNETCTGSNGDYYNHPAFTFGDNELTGFWIGKFEISSSDPNAITNGGGNTTSLTTKIIPNVVSWRSNPVSNCWKVIYDMQASSNIYGLPTDRTNIDSHMLTNMEWGAVAYLTNSKYGKCTDGTCTEVELNSNNNYTTGCGPQSQGSTSSGSTCNAYNTALGMLASTTGNIYGVYDMSGGGYDYVMGNMSSASGSYTYYPGRAGTNYTYTGNEKYITTYSYGTTDTDQQAYNRARLGDATGEVMLSASSSGAWYSDYSHFPYSYNPWFERGGYFNGGSNAGVFNFSRGDGGSYGSGSARAALAGFAS